MVCSNHSSWYHGVPAAFVNVFAHQPQTSCQLNKAPVSRQQCADQPAKRQATDTSVIASCRCGERLSKRDGIESRQSEFQSLFSNGFWAKGHTINLSMLHATEVARISIQVFLQVRVVPFIVGGVPFHCATLVESTQ